MLPPLPEALFDLRVWDTLSRAECEHVARTVEAKLPPTFQFQCIETYTQVDQTHHIAFFEWYDPQAPFLENQDLFPHSPWKEAKKGTVEWQGCFNSPHWQRAERQKHILFQSQFEPGQYHEAEMAGWKSAKAQKTRFALLPGMSTTLGYDRSHPFHPSETLLQSWLESDDKKIDREAAKKEHLQEGDVSYSYHTWYDYLDRYTTPLRHVTILPFLLEDVPLYPSFLFDGDSVLYQGESWQPVQVAPIYITRFFPHQGISEYLEQQGFCLPSSDEWEYACKGGTTTFFYWGEGMISHSFLKLKEFPPPPKNAFGLTMPRITYNWEWCREPGIMRGGDGGSCMGSWLIHCLTLAPTYFQMWEQMVRHGHLRRVYRLLD